MKCGPSSARSKSASVPKTTRTLATATPSLQSNGIPSWCSTSRWASAISTPRTHSWKVSGTRRRVSDFRSPLTASHRTAPRSPHAGRPLRLRHAHQGLSRCERRRRPVQPRRSAIRGGSPSHGQPDPDRICTSIIERSNLCLRMGLRRFTRLTNGFSKKWENHWAAVALWYAFYNFCRVHKSLRITPAMAAGISDHVWSVRELLEAA